MSYSPIILEELLPALKNLQLTIKDAVDDLVCLFEQRKRKRKRKKGEKKKQILIEMKKQTTNVNNLFYFYIISIQKILKI